MNPGISVPPASSGVFIDLSDEAIELQCGPCSCDMDTCQNNSTCGCAYHNGD